MEITKSNCRKVKEPNGSGMMDLFTQFTLLAKCYVWLERLQLNAGANLSPLYSPWPKVPRTLTNNSRKIFRVISKPS